MSNQTAVIFGKETDLFLLLMHALGQLECFLLSWYMKIDSNLLININISFKNLGDEISDVVP